MAAPSVRRDLFNMEPDERRSTDFELGVYRGVQQACHALIPVELPGPRSVQHHQATLQLSATGKWLGGKRNQKLPIFREKDGGVWEFRADDIEVDASQFEDAPLVDESGAFLHVDRSLQAYLAVRGYVPRGYVDGFRGAVPPLVIIHGVPMRKEAHTSTLVKRLGNLMPIINVDMGGMGGSSKWWHAWAGDAPWEGVIEADDAAYNAGWVAHIRDVGGTRPLTWAEQADLIRQVVNRFIGEKGRYYVLGADWGGGIATHMSVIEPERLLGTALLNPIWKDGHPVAEIQAFGRLYHQFVEAMGASKDDAAFFEEFAPAVGAADQTMVQILKTMVTDPSKFNRYTTWAKRTYVESDYTRLKPAPASTQTLRLRAPAILSLAAIAFELAPAQLDQYDERLAPNGVAYERWGPQHVLVAWGADDNMMPASQPWRIREMIERANPTRVIDVETSIIHGAGHFSDLDKPAAVSEAVAEWLRRIQTRVNRTELERANQCVTRDMDLRLAPYRLADTYVGFGACGPVKGDEFVVIARTRELDKVPGEAASCPAIE